MKLCPDFGFYSYYSQSGTSWMGPQMFLRTIASDLRLAAKHGCSFFHVDGWSNWATNAPMNYLLRRLPWDVDADPEAILDEWYRGVYGVAAVPMKKYWETLAEGRYQVSHSSSKPKRPDLMFTRDYRPCPTVSERSRTGGGFCRRQVPPACGDCTGRHGVHRPDGIGLWFCR